MGQSFNADYVSSEEIQFVIEQHMKIVIDHCIDLDPNLISIILYGSYGRDEGSWFQDEKKIWRPYNDYDILIISKSKQIDKKKLKELRVNLALKIDIKWIDITILTPNELKKLKPSILNYDIKYASKIIYGDELILNVIPDISRADIPLKDIETLFFTRLYALIGSIQMKSFKVGLSKEDSMFFRYQMAKAVLAIIDVLLLQIGQYDSSYRNRISQFVLYFPEKRELKKLAEWALSEKFRPKALKMTPELVVDLYQQVHKLYFEEMFSALSKHYNRNIFSPTDIELCLKWKPKAILKRFYFFIKFRNLSHERNLNLMLAQSYLIYAWRLESINQRWLLLANKLLKKIETSFNLNSSWEEARILCAQLRAN